jgi:hypothetical protein
MDLYIIKAPNRPPTFRGTQIDARATAKALAGTWEPVVVPDRKEERLCWLSDFASRAYANGRGDALAGIAQEPRQDPKRAMDAATVLSRMDGGEVDVDALVETILNSRGYTLGRFAGAVAAAFSRIATKQS